MKDFSGKGKVWEEKKGEWGERKGKRGGGVRKEKGKGCFFGGVMDR